jgi:hypothetical protein
MSVRTLRVPFARIQALPPRRDNPSSAFADILERLAARLPGVLALVLVDSEGETVDYWTRRDPYEARVVGAQVQLFFRLVSEGLKDPPVWATFRFGPDAPASSHAAARPPGTAAGGEETASTDAATAKSSSVSAETPGTRTLYARRVGPVYTLVAEFDAAVTRMHARRALEVTERELADEGGWEAPASLWTSVRVDQDSKGRPYAVVDGQGVAQELQILGKIQGLPPRERGWRIRLSQGREMNLVREPGEFWYVDGRF